MAAWRRSRRDLGEDLSSTSCLLLLGEDLVEIFSQTYHSGQARGAFLYPPPRCRETRKFVLLIDGGCTTMYLACFIMGNGCCLYISCVVVRSSMCHTSSAYSVWSRSGLLRVPTVRTILLCILLCCYAASRRMVCVRECTSGRERERPQLGVRDTIITSLREHVK